MMPRRLLCSLAALAAAAFSFAWDGDGHTIIGIIAYDQLNSDQRAKLVAILNEGETLFRVDPSSEPFNVGRVATWADFIKGVTNSDYEKEIKEFNDWAYPPSQAGTDKEAVRCKVWHYKDKVVLEGTQNRFKEPPFDAVKAVNLAVKRFPTESTNRMKAWWLYWLFHVVGDLHQPLHCVSSLQFDARGDAGGNFFKLNGEVKNLHWLWDSGIKDAVSRPGWRGGLVEKAAMIEKLHPQTEFAQQLKDLDPDKWVDEGADIAVTEVYAGIQPETVPSADYDAKRLNRSLTQAALGGFRLGAILKQLLK